MGVISGIERCVSASDQRVWYIAPTYRQAEMIAWRYLMGRLRLFPKSFQDYCNINQSKLQVEFPPPTNSLFEFKGVEDPDKLRGAGLDYIILDEYGDDNYGREPVWNEILRPGLSDKRGDALIISTPKGYNHLYDLYERGASGLKEYSNWGSWKMPTWTNPYIAEEEIEDAKQECRKDPGSFEQEWGAEFRSKQGLVYKKFDRDIHVIRNLEPEEIPASWQMEVALDFGAAHPTAAVYVLFDNIYDVAYVVDEYYQAGEPVKYNAGQMKALEARWYQAPKVRWGDSQAKQTIMEYNAHDYPITPANKKSGSVATGISKIQERLLKDPLARKFTGAAAKRQQYENNPGCPKLLVCRRCVNLIKEFENYEWKSNNSAERKAADAPEKAWDDALDALRYVILHHAEPIGRKPHQVKKRRSARNKLAGI